MLDWQLILFCTHEPRREKNALQTIRYENTPIQIYRKFHLQKLKIFR